MTNSELHNVESAANEGSAMTSTEDPDELAGNYLELPGSTGQHHTFTFARANSFIQIDNIPTFQLRCHFSICYYFDFFCLAERK